MQQREPRVRLGAAPRRIAGEPRGLHLPESRCSNGGAGAGGRAYDRARLPSRSSHVPPGSSNLCTENAPRPPPASEHVRFSLYGNGGGAERLFAAVAQNRGEVHTCQLCARRISGMAHPYMRSFLFFTPRRFDPGDEAAGGSRCPRLDCPRSHRPRTAAPLQPSLSFSIFHAAGRRVSARGKEIDGIRQGDNVHTRRMP
jgi:hypothetical protein